MTRFTFRPTDMPPIRGRLTYVTDESSFVYDPDEAVEFVDAEIGAGTLAISCSSRNGALVTLDGYCPRQRWISAPVTRPSAEPRRLAVEELHELQVPGLRAIAPEDEFEHTYDDRTGLLRVALRASAAGAHHYEIATDIVIELDDDRALTALLLTVHEATGAEYDRR